MWRYRVGVSPPGVVEVVDGEPHAGDDVCQGRLRPAVGEAQEMAKRMKRIQISFRASKKAPRPSCRS